MISAYHAYAYVNFQLSIISHRHVKFRLDCRFLRCVTCTVQDVEPKLYGLHLSWPFTSLAYTEQELKTDMSADFFYKYTVLYGSDKCQVYSLTYYSNEQ